MKLEQTFSCKKCGKQDESKNMYRLIAWYCEECYQKMRVKKREKNESIEKESCFREKEKWRQEKWSRFKRVVRGNAGNVD